MCLMQAIALKPDNPRAYLATAVALGRLGAQEPCPDRTGPGLASAGHWSSDAAPWRRHRCRRAFHVSIQPFLSLFAAIWSENGRKIAISKTVREHVAKCLSLDPDDDVALHVLGRWEYEMARTHPRPAHICEH